MLTRAIYGIVSITLINRLIILILSSFIFISCVSSIRYTTKDNSESKSESKKAYSNLEETYKDYKALESNIEIASYYSDDFHGKRTANGEIYNMYDYTAAHISYPFNTIVRVTNLSNDRTVVVRINDRKPDTNNRAIDLSLKAAHELRMISSGITKVKIEVLEWGDK
jgi:rare lipoprotein A